MILECIDPILFHSGNKRQFKRCPKSVSNYQNQLVEAEKFFKKKSHFCLIPLFMSGLYDKSAKDKSANDTSAKPTVRMPTVRKGQQYERDKSANVKCANASSAMRHWCEKSATAVRMTTVRKRTLCRDMHVLLYRQILKDRVLGSSKPLFSPKSNPFPNHILTEIPLPKPELLPLSKN